MSTDEKNFKKLFYDNYQQLCNLAFKYLGDREESEDLVQNLMIRFWELKKEMINNPTAKYYLFTSVRNRCISVLRKKIHFINIDEIQIDIKDEIYEEKPNQDVEALVKTAFENIPPKCLEIFKMCRIQKLSYKEVAQKLNLSVKTVENQMGKAIKYIRQFIEQHPIAP